MDNHQNLKCYEGVESVQLRLPEKEFDAYMQDKLRSADSDLEFIKQRVVEKRGKLDVCEIGSGNSKLLYRLEADDVIKNKAVGYEVAESRYRLAEKFKSALQSKLVDNRHQNFLDAPPEEQYDLIIMVDIVLQMIASLDAEAEAQAMDWLYQSIYRGGIFSSNWKTSRPFCTKSTWTGAESIGSGMNFHRPIPTLMGCIA